MKKALYRRRSIGIKERAKDTDEKVQCLECGNWYKVVSGSHLGRTHVMSTRCYCEKYGVEKKDMIGQDTLERRRLAGKRAYKLGLIGTPESLKKARMALISWQKEHPELTKRNAIKASKKGDINRMAYWTKDDRKKKGVWQSKKSKEFWSNPKNTDKQKRVIEKLVAGQKEKFEYYEKVFKICPVCGKKFMPMTRLDRGYLKHADSGKRWEQRKTCSRKCAFVLLKGRVFSKETKSKLSASLKNYWKTKNCNFL